MSLDFVSSPDLAEPVDRSAARTQWLGFAWPVTPCPVPSSQIGEAWVGYRIAVPVAASSQIGAAWAHARVVAPPEASSRIGEH